MSGLPSRYVHAGELDVLCYLLQGARTVVEFGCNNGRTAAAILRNVASVEKYVGVDVPAGYQFACKTQAKEVPARPGELALSDARFSVLVRNRGTFDLMSGELPDADAVFIDGDHSEAAVRNDYRLARSIVRPGGIIVFHDDHGMPVVDVSRVLDVFCDGGADINHVAGTWLAFERVPAANEVEAAA